MISDASMRGAWDNMAEAPLISRDALVRAMVAALESRSSSNRHGITETEVREFVDLIYESSLEEDSSKMKDQIEKFLEKVAGGS